MTSVQSSECTRTRVCNQCGGIEFYSSNKCKACSKVANAKWKSANKDKIKITNAAYALANSDAIRAYQQKNKEKVNLASAKYRAKNVDKCRAAVAKSTRANPEKRRASIAAWMLKNKARKAATNAAWQAANPGRHNIVEQNRRAQKKMAGGKLTRDLSTKLFKLQRGKCPCCKKPLGNDFHLDHKMPLALGGANTDDNMQLLRATCNLQKSKKHPVDFMQQRGFLL